MKNEPPTYTFGDVLDVINAVAPDAIARMLQAGAEAYLPAVGMTRNE